MDSGSMDLADLSGRLASSGKQAYVRALVRRAGDGWELHHAWAVIGTEPPGWSEEAWCYEQLAFVGCNVRTAALAVLCTGEGVITLGQIQAAVPATQGSANWSRQPSYVRYDRLLLPWPATEFTIARSGSAHQLPHDMLVGQSCPSFPEPNSAWRAFSEGNYSLIGARQPPDQLGVIRFAEDDAWIGHIRVTATQLIVEVHGSAVSGAELELNGVTERSTQPVTGPGALTFPLERGLPSSAWLWLKRGTSWLDYRSVDTGSGELARAGVEFDIPVEPQANVEALLAAGEGPQIEYKRQLPETAEQKRKMLKTVAAFATCDGGTMAFGIDPDEVTVTGLGQGDPKALRDRLYQLVHQIIVPSPDVTVTDYQVDHQTILILEVEPGPTPPYGLAADKGSRDKPEYFVRRGSSTYPAQPGELREAARGRPPAPQTGNAFTAGY